MGEQVGEFERLGVSSGSLTSVQGNRDRVAVHRLATVRI